MDARDRVNLRESTQTRSSCRAECWMVLSRDGMPAQRTTQAEGFFRAVLRMLARPRTAAGAKTCHLPPGLILVAGVAHVRGAPTEPCGQRAAVLALPLDQRRVMSLRARLARLQGRTPAAEPTPDLRISLACARHASPGSPSTALCRSAAALPSEVRLVATLTQVVLIQRKRILARLTVEGAAWSEGVVSAVVRIRLQALHGRRRDLNFQL